MNGLDEKVLSKEAIKTRDMRKVAAYRKYLYKHPDLRYLFFELTDACNLRCRHCGSNCTPANTQYADTKLLINLLDQLKDDFSDADFMICLTGGEPLLHPDFETIAEAINERGIPWGMTTNATLIDLEMARKLKKLKMGSISVSLDGLKQSHEWLRRFPGCFDQTIDGIRNLHSAGHKVQVTTVVSKQNFDELEELFELMKELKVDSWRVINLEPIGRAHSEISSLLLDDEEMRKLLGFIREKRYDINNRMDIRYGCSHYLSYDFEREVRDGFFLCRAGLCVASILVNGDIFGCPDIERRPKLIQGNIARDRFYDIWVNGFKPYRVDRSNMCDQCKGCKEKTYCAGDSLHTWDFENNRPKICLLT